MKRDEEFFKKIKKAEKTAQYAMFFTSLATILLLLSIYDPTLSVFNSQEKLYEEVVVDEDRIENGIHVRTGLKDGKGLMTVVNNCTNCNSAKLVTQNRMNAERWNETIKWMQEKQNLWQLGENQEIIVNYLVENYPVNQVGRRMTLSNIDWYELKD